MEFISMFDVIGPNMIGPSSSHTAGAASLAALARKLYPHPITQVEFVLYGSFAQTYQGHGTDKALVGGILGFLPQDSRIKDSFSLAEAQGVEVEFRLDTLTSTSHPNTVDIILGKGTPHQQEVRGESTGGGKVRIVGINGIEVDFTGEYSTLIIKQVDRPGVIAHITRCFHHYQANIAFLRVFREEKGATAYTVIESDAPIPPQMRSEIETLSAISAVTLIQKEGNYV